VQKQPTEQGLKASGLSICRRVPPPGPPASPITAPAHKVALGIAELLVKLLQSKSLGICAHHLNNFLVQGVGAAWTLTALQAVVKLPDRIT
jgi:hypothetical protein